MRFHFGAGREAIGVRRADSLLARQGAKQYLVRASLAAIEAIRVVDSTVHFLQPEPVVHINIPAGKPELEHGKHRLSVCWVCRYQRLPFNL
ncbi:MAG: hypothetical protein GPOALKHO_000717 [Sodalis sp.]|nr:MAG: hypothetical protein GPOALKHO_000717 [Sodalis sp.]